MGEFLFCSFHVGSAAAEGWGMREEPWASERIQLHFVKQQGSKVADAPSVGQWSLPVGHMLVWLIFIMFASCLRNSLVVTRPAELRDVVVPWFVKAKLCFLKPQTWKVTPWMSDRLEEASEASASSLSS